MASISELTEMFHSFAGTTTSPLYTTLSATVAEHREVVELLAAAPPTQHSPVLLLAAVHDLLLAEPDHRLARWYPNLTDEPRGDDPSPEFLQFCRARADDIRALIASRTTQTNEIGRCTFLMPTLHVLSAEVGALSLLDVGTSAGLNLLLDRYDYRYDPGGELRLGSRVLLEAGTRGAVPVPGSPPPIVDRLGLDRSPIDVTDPAQARWLEACVWPDETHRFERLAGAIEIARDDPPKLVSGDAVDDLAATLDRLDPAGHPTIVNSWVLSYLDREQRDLYTAELAQIGTRRDLTWVFAESPALTPGLPVPLEVDGGQLTELIAVRWRDGHPTSHHLARVHPHGRWLHWGGS